MKSKAEWYRPDDKDEPIGEEDSRFENLEKEKKRLLNSAAAMISIVPTA